MNQPARTTLPILVLMTLGALACDDATDPTEGLAGLDPVALEAAVDGLLFPLQFTAEPTRLLAGAFPTLTADGVTLQRAPRSSRRLPGTANRWIPVGITAVATPARVEFPPAVRGQTYVYDTQENAWTIDPQRTGAPSNGARIVWYGTDATGQVIEPLNEVGYIDLTDEDEGTLSRIGVLMAALDAGRGVPLADLTQGSRSVDGDDWTEYFEAAGFFSDGENDTNFGVVSDAAGNETTGDQTVDFTVDLDGADVAYTMELAAVVDGDTGNSDETLTITATRGSDTTILSLSLAVMDAGQAGTGTLTHNGTVVAEITVQGSSFDYTRPDGGSLPGTQETRVDALVTALFQTGFLAFLNLPLLFG